MKNFTLSFVFFTLLLTGFVSKANNPHHPFNCNHKCDARYYYIPEIDSYYDLKANLYVWRDCDIWIRSYRLPHHLQCFNQNNVVVIHHYSGPEPYLLHHNNRPNHYAPVIVEHHQYRPYPNKRSHHYQNNRRNHHERGRR